MIFIAIELTALIRARKRKDMQRPAVMWIMNIGPHCAWFRGHRRAIEVATVRTQAFIPHGYLEPFLGAAAIWINQDAFAESGGTAALRAPAQGYDLANTTLGLRGETAFDSTWPLTARGLIGWRHAYGDIAPSTVLLFAGSTQPFTIAGTPIDRNAGVVEAGLFYDVSSAVKLGLSYSGQYGNHASDNAVKASLNVQF